MPIAPGYPQAPKPEEPEPARELVGEEERELMWRVEQFEKLGADPHDALDLALGHADWHTFQRMIRAGCPTSVAVRILA